MTPSHKGAAAQNLVNQQIQSLLYCELYWPTQEEVDLVNALHKVALWMVKPLGHKDLNQLEIQSFSSPESAFMVFRFKREEFQVMLHTFHSFFGPLVNLKCGKIDKVFDLEDRKAFEVYRDYILEDLGAA